MIGGSSGPLKKRGVDNGPCVKIFSVKRALTRQLAARLSCELPTASSSLIIINSPIRVRSMRCGSVVILGSQCASLKIWTKSFTKSFSSGSSNLASTIVTARGANSPSLTAIRFFSSARNLRGANLRSILVNSRFAMAASRLASSLARSPGRYRLLAPSLSSCAAVLRLYRLQTQIRRRVQPVARQSCSQIRSTIANISQIQRLTWMTRGGT